MCFTAKPEKDKQVKEGELFKVLLIAIQIPSTAVFGVSNRPRKTELDLFKPDGKTADNLVYG